jgi:HSP20 family protein
MPLEGNRSGIVLAPSLQDLAAQQQDNGRRSTMADVSIKNKGKEAQSSGEGRQSGSQSLQSQTQERGMSKYGPSSIFSLTPRDFFMASPFELMRRFTEDMDRFFEVGTPSTAWSQTMGMWSPPIEVKEADGRLSICAELPGLRKEDIKVELTPEGLVISGERKREHEEKRGGIYRSERSYGSFTRTVPIPDEAQIDQAKASFENGILTVNVPVPEMTQRRREIPIEVNGGQSAQRK